MTWEVLNDEVGVVNAHPDKAKLLGEIGIIEDNESSGSGSQLRKKNSGMPILVRRVRFGGVLSPSTRVKWTSAYAGTRVEAAGAELAHGVVDPFLSADTAAGDIGLIFISGPMDVIASAAIAADARIKGAASGKVVTDSTIADGLSEGRCIEAAAADDDVIRCLMNFPQT